MVIADAVLVLTLLSLGAWLGLLFARDGFWRAHPRDDGLPSIGAEAPAVTAIVPARNEAATIGRALRSLLDQTYPGTFRIVLVDDSSEDETARIAADLAAADLAAASGRHGLEVVRAGPLPPGWMGKMWALRTGVRHAADRAPAWLLFTDADIEHDPGNLARLTGHATSANLDLVSLMVRLRCTSFWERLLIPPFVFFFQMLYPFPAVNRPDSGVAAAAGGCVLIRREALEAAGGIEAIRNELIDDVALARAVKSSGGRLWLGLGSTTRSIRPYDGLEPIWRMVVRSADTQLGHSLLALAGTVAGMAIVFLMPLAALVLGVVLGQGVIVALSMVTYGLMLIAYAPTARWYGLPLSRLAFLPVAALLYVLMTIDSAVQFRAGRGGAWKGRVAAAQHDDAME